MLTDFEQFVDETFAFVKKCVPTAGLMNRPDAVAKIVKQFKFLFDKDGKRIANPSPKNTP